MLVTVLNYAHQLLPVQLRVAGSFSLVQYESPGELATLLPYSSETGSRKSWCRRCEPVGEYFYRTALDSTVALRHGYANRATHTELQ